MGRHKQDSKLQGSHVVPVSATAPHQPKGPVPVSFTCESLICQSMDAGGKWPGWACLASTPFCKDVLSAVLTTLSATLSLYIAVLKEYGKRARTTDPSASLEILTWFSLAYPMITMTLLILRAKEVCMRKECYWVLLRHRVVMDWQNWSWAPNCITGADNAHCIWLHSGFFWYFAATSAALCYWAAQRSGWQLVVVVILQIGLMFQYYTSTLRVERYIFSFNAFIEDSRGTMSMQDAQAFVNSGLRVVPERVLRRYAVLRCRQLPSRFSWLTCCNSNYERAMAAWRRQARGDLDWLPTATEEDFPVSWADRLYSLHFWGVHMLNVMEVHPDLHAANAGATLYQQVYVLPVLVAMGAVLLVEVYGIYQQWEVISG